MDGERPPLIDYELYSMFLGRPVAYWRELELHVEELNYQDLISEIVTLKRQVKALQTDIDRISRVVRKYLP